MMAVKDFVNGDGGRPQWVRLGDGIVPTTSILEYVREAGFTGPISIHIEYGPHEPDFIKTEIRESAKVLRKLIAGAGYA